MSKRTGIIYKATLNGKSYIGMTVQKFDKRRAAHLRSKGDAHFQRAIRKHGAHNVEWRVIAKGIAESELPQWERFYIQHYDTFRNGYNSTAGGEGARGQQ